MSTYLGHGKRQTAQDQPIPGSSQVANSAGGYSFEVDDWTRLERFLVLGSEGGTYYIGEADLTKANVGSLRRLLQEDGETVVAKIVEVSEAGRNVKQQPVIFALAMCAGEGDAQTKGAALAALSRVCRTGTHLYLFATYIEQFRGWGRSLRRAIGEWYVGRDLDALAYQLVKYRQREGWRHADLLRLAHPAREVSSGNPKLPVTADQEALFAWVSGGYDIAARSPGEGERFDAVPAAVEAYIGAQRATRPSDTVKAIETFGDKLPREAIKPEHLSDPDVNLALLRAGMPMTALIRNLGNLTRLGVLKSGSEGLRIVLDQLADRERLRRARVHPVTVLSALKVYVTGQGFRGQNAWEPIAPVADALDSAFYAAFANVEPTNKRIRLALDVSSSMATPVAGVPFLSCSEGAAAMALVTAATEPQHEIVAFSTAGRSSWSSPSMLAPVAISPRQRLDDVLHVTQEMTFGGTDCSLPMVDALEKGLSFDAFVVLTDSETWAGSIHPVQALRQYRERTGIAAKLIVVGMEANEFSIADPADAGMLDVVGFDSAAPQVMADFIR